ncbi:unnamed protein product [Auanema sp. JU1783]|nr:unnamed protein product [Auanema sp. JU1783]
MNVRQLIEQYRGNKKALLFIVYIALFLDNMLLTAIVPIIPEYLMKLNFPDASKDILDQAKLEEADRFKRQTTWDDDSWDIPANKMGRKKTTALSYVATTPPWAPESEQDFAMGPTRSRIRNEPVRNATTRPLSLDDKHALIAKENILVGLMFGSKALVQLLVNPWVGPLTNRIGYSVPMFVGFVIMFLSTLLFAFGESYPMLWLARAMQGVGSACTSTSGMGMLAQAYPDDAERGSAMGIALGGLALGVLVGPPYGGILYQWSGKELPFVILALLALFDGSLQFAVLQPKISKGEPEGSTIRQLAKDPYIIVAAGAITIGNLGIAMLEPSLPLWMMESWGANSFERGAAFIPASISYLVGTNIFGPLAHRMGRWLSALIGLVVIGLSLLSIPSATSVSGLILPHLFMGLSIGMIDASMFPLMGYLVDIRHVGVYGSIYAIADAAFCFAFALGPFFSGPLVRSVGFPTMLYIIAVISFAYAPLMYLLRDPPSINREEEQTVNTGMLKAAPERYDTIPGTNVIQMEGYHY